MRSIESINRLIAHLDQVQEEHELRNMWGGQETAEEEERKMIEGPTDEIHGTPALQEKIHDVKSEECDGVIGV